MVIGCKGKINLNNNTISIECKGDSQTLSILIKSDKLKETIYNEILKLTPVMIVCERDKDDESKLICTSYLENGEKTKTVYDLKKLFSGEIEFESKTEVAE